VRRVVRGGQHPPTLAAHRQQSGAGQRRAVTSHSRQRSSPTPSGSASADCDGRYWIYMPMRDGHSGLFAHFGNYSAIMARSGTVRCTVHLRTVLGSGLAHFLDFDRTESRPVAFTVRQSVCFPEKSSKRCAKARTAATGAQPRGTRLQRGLEHTSLQSPLKIRGRLLQRLWSCAFLGFGDSSSANNPAAAM
jgi:hypothetical protein